MDIQFPADARPQGVNEGELTRQGQFYVDLRLYHTFTGLIEVPFRGRFLKIPGDRTFEAWTATFYNTADFNLRAAFEQWINLGNQVDENIGATTGLDAIFKDIYIRQLSKDASGSTAAGSGSSIDKNKVLRTYKLVDAWPTSVGAINVAFDSNDALEEFDVEFQFQYLDASRPGQNNTPANTTTGFLSEPDLVV